MSQQHFTRDERVKLQSLKTAGLSNRAIACQLGFHPSSIGRELKRGASNETKSGYSVRAAQNHTKQQRLKANQQHRKLRRVSLLSFYVTLRLCRYWSPEQIASRLGKRLKNFTIGYHAIYRWLWHHAAIKWLRRFLRHPKLRRKYGTKRREKQRELAKKRSIEKRSNGANNRSRYGHWEGDLIAGAKNSGFIVTLVERKSRYLLAHYIPKATKDNTKQAILKMFDDLPGRMKLSLTLDNGTEMNDYEVIEKRGGITVYFAHPYHSWERGTSENTNGLLRQFFPKGSDFSNVTQDQVDLAVSLINTRPRKLLRFENPVERLKNSMLQFER